MATGQAIVHPMQVVTYTGDFIGWGTARGVGTNVPGAISNCPDDYSAGWHVYIDGTKFLDYFCRQEYGTIGSTATDQVFKLKPGVCNGVDKWKATVNGNLKTCQKIDNNSYAAAASVGGEVIGTSGQLHVDVHYYELQRYWEPTDFWYDWSLSIGDECVNTGYRLRFSGGDNVWVEEYP